MFGPEFSSSSRPVGGGGGFNPIPGRFEVSPLRAVGLGAASDCGRSVERSGAAESATGEGAMVAGPLAAACIRSGVGSYYVAILWRRSYLRGY